MTSLFVLAISESLEQAHESKSKAIVLSHVICEIRINTKDSTLDKPRNEPSILLGRY
ncbi:MAG: hypothetical protein QXZ48_00120 [Zestosphaera sp.]